MRKICRIVISLFWFLYVLALLLLAVGTFGLFGVERDPLSAVFLIPLGLPWNTFGVDAPEEWLPWIGILAPLINLMLLSILCRFLCRRKE